MFLYSLRLVKSSFAFSSLYLNSVELKGTIIGKPKSFLFVSSIKREYLYLVFSGKLTASLSISSKTGAYLAGDQDRLAQIRTEALAARETGGSYTAKDGSKYTGKQQKKKRSNTVTREDAEALLKKIGSDNIEDIITELERQMIEAAEALEFERAATIRDQIRDLRNPKD